MCVLRMPGFLHKVLIIASLAGSVLSCQVSLAVLAAIISAAWIKLSSFKLELPLGSASRLRRGRGIKIRSDRRSTMPPLFDVGCETQQAIVCRVSQPGEAGLVARMPQSRYAPMPSSSALFSLCESCVESMRIIGVCRGETENGQDRWVHARDGTQYANAALRSPPPAPFT